jgi:hypothetical protein
VTAAPNPSPGLGLVEWEVPESVAVASVTGSDVRGWSRSGSRLQAWLQNSARSAELTVTGWWTGPPGVVKPVAGTGPLKPETWELPRLALVGVPGQAVTVRLYPEAGLDVETVKLHNLTSPRPGGWTTPASGLTLTSTQNDYGGSFLLRPAAGGGPLQIFTLAELREGQVALTSRLVGRLPAPLGADVSHDRAVTVRVQNGAGTELRLWGANVARMREDQGTGPERSYHVELNPAAQGKLDLTLTAVLPVEKLAGGLALPDVSVERAATDLTAWLLGGGRGAPLPAERWLAVVGPGLIGQAPQKLELVGEVETAWKTWPRDLQRTGREGSIWKVLADGWALRLAAWGPVVRPGRSPVRVLLVEHALTAEERTWRHQATCWLYALAGSDLQLTLPAGAVLHAATVDGDSVPLLPVGGAATPQAGEGSWWLPLAGGAGPRWVRLCWSFAEGSENLYRPNLTNPRLESVMESGTAIEPAAVVWMMGVPAGYHVAPALTGPGPVQPGVAVLEARRAEAQLRVCEALIETARLRGEGLVGAVSADLTTAQVRLARSLRLARAGLTNQPNPRVGPQGENLTEWLQELEDSNGKLAQEAGFEAIKEAAEKQAAGEEPLSRTDPLALVPLPTNMLLWQGADAKPPEVRVSADADRLTWRSLAMSGLLLTVLLTAWVLSFAPGMLNWARAFWPEQLVLLACLTWQTVGLNALVVALAGLGVAGRGVLLVGQVVSWLFGKAKDKG